MTSKRRRQRQRGRQQAPVVNSGLADRVANTVVSQFFQSVQTTKKHNGNYDFGYPDQITFLQFHQIYKRNGFARAGIQHAINKTWREYPELLEGSMEPHDKTTNERNVAEMIDRLSFWAKLREADERSRVGEYGGLVFRFADSQKPEDPVDRVPGGIAGLVEVIPCWQDQLKPSEYDTNTSSATYGQPTMYQFNEAAVDPSDRKIRSFPVHPDRVHIWSRDSTVHGESTLEAGYNDLLTIEKIIGSGGEGFWKNAKSAPVLNIDPAANPETLASFLGVTTKQLADKLDEVVAGWQKGFDQLLMFQGIEAKTLGVTLPQPAEFLMGALQSYAASINEPLKILVGSQSGERASTEDANEWDSTIMSRRENYVKPNVRRVVEKLVKVGVMPEATGGDGWMIGWTDLSEDSMDEKIARAEKMAKINKELLGTGERAFTSEEIREVVGLEPLEDNDMLAEDDDAQPPEDD